jgi:NAD(P)-dependent dehydrogenase (short-subunit alcohol dehydrogenase family)
MKMTNTMSLDAELRVLVTAGTSGIGRIIAETFALAGARIHICDNSEQMLDECSVAHPDWGYTFCDVSNEADVSQLFADAQRDLGGLDVLINNAGIAGPTGGIDTMSSAEWQQTVNVNLNGQFYCAKLAVPLLKQSQNASIICMSSVAGRFDYAYRTPYAATKWAIIGLVKSLAIELGPVGIRVNALLPGIVEGPQIDKVIAARDDDGGSL